MSRGKAVFSILSQGFAGVALLALSGAGCLGSFTKLKDASEAKASTSANFDVLSLCGSFETYRLSADPVLQRQCMGCHASGGKGAGKLLYISSSGNENETIATNFSANLTKLLTDDAGDLDSNPLLARLNGVISHDITLDIAGEDYGFLRAWAQSERETPCTSTATP